MRPQMALILALFRQDVNTSWRVSPGQTQRMWHSISSYHFEAISAAKRAGWLELSENKDSVRLTERGQIVARQEHVRQRQQKHQAVTGPSP